MITLRENDVARVGKTSVGTLLPVRPGTLMHEMCPVELLDRNADAVQLLVTPAIAYVADTVRAWATAPPSHWGGLILTGAGGAGKSTAMYIAVAAARAAGVRVVYIPRAPDRPRLLCEAVRSQSESGLIPEEAWRDIDALLSLGVGEKEHEAAERVLRILESSSHRSTPRIMLAVDQWNLLVGDDAPNTGYIRMLRDFSTLLSSFNVVAAFSSTFSVPRGVTRDADWTTFQYSVATLTADQLHALLDARRSAPDTPWPPETQLSDARTMELTGGVPRMVEYLRRALARHANDVGAAERVFEIAATTHYVQRVRALLDRHPSQAVLAVAAILVRNATLADVPEAWDSAGLIVRDAVTQQPRPVCEAARRAVMRVARSDRTNLVKLLASDPTTRWLALELLLTTSLVPVSTQQAALVLPYTDLCGKPLDAARPSLWLTVTRAVHQTDEPWDERIPAGTAVVCRPGFPVVDFFVHTTAGLRVFVQASLSPYGKHSTHARDLFTASAVQGGESVFEYFMRRSDGKARKGTTKLPAGTEYVYVCPRPASEARMVKPPAASNGDSKVVLACELELHAMGGDWAMPQLYQCS